MRLKTLHVADIHIGKNRKYLDYLEQQGWMLDAILKQVEEACDDPAIDLVHFVVAGDLFEKNEDTRRSEFVLFLTRVYQPLCRLHRKYTKLHTFFIDGNHDRQPFVKEPSVLSPLFGMVPKNWHMALVEPKYVEEHSFLLLPFKEYSTADFSAFIRKYTPTFIAAHECLARMKTDVGFSPPRDQDKYAEVNDFLPESKVVSMFLGDIHRCQAMDDDGVSWYAGSPVTLDFGHRLPKGVLHHTFVKGTAGWQRDGAPKLHTLEDGRIRCHRSLGKILDTDDIPWDLVTNHKAHYLSLIVSPDVFKEISDKEPLFFSSPHVDFEFDKRIQNTKTAGESAVSSLESDEDLTTDLSDDYYELAISEWMEINLTSFDASLKEDFLKRVFTNFVGK